MHTSPLKGPKYMYQLQYYNNRVLSYEDYPWDYLKSTWSVIGFLATHARSDEASD